MNVAYEKAIVLYDQGRFDDAAKHLTQALAEENSSRVLAMLSLTYRALRKNELALQRAQEAVSIAPHDGFAYYALSFAQNEHVPRRPLFGVRGLPAIDASDPKRQLTLAIESARQAISCDPFNPDFHARLSSLEAARAKWRASLDAAEKGLVFDPHHAGCAEARARALRYLDRSKEAIAETSRVLQTHAEDAAMLSERAWALLDIGVLDDAVECFESSLRINPNRRSAAFGLRAARWARRSVFIAVPVRVVAWSQTSGRLSMGGIAVLCGLGTGVLESAAGLGRPVAISVAFLLFFVLTLLAWVVRTCLKLLASAS